MGGQLTVEVQTEDPAIADAARAALAAGEIAVGSEATIVVGTEGVELRPGQCHVVLVPGPVDRRITGALLSSGASAVVPLDALANGLAAVVRAVDAGFTAVPNAGRSAVERPVLTARQQQILSLLVLGLSNGVIAQRLYLTESTVKTHLTTIFRKLGVRSRKEAIDLILDPASGLEVGIVGVSGGDRGGSAGEGGYAAPTIRS